MSRNLESRLNALEERVNGFKPVLVRGRISSKETIEAAKARYKRLHGCNPDLILTYRRID